MKVSLFLTLPVQKQMFNTVKVTDSAACYCIFIIRPFKKTNTWEV